MNSPYRYELPFVHIQDTSPEAYTRNVNGDDDTIDSESEDIRRDLKGTPTSSRRGSYSTPEHERVKSFYPQRDHQDWSDHNDDKKEDETNSDIVYPNKSLLNELCSGDLPPILSLGDYEDDENVVIENPFCYESNNVTKNSPKRNTTTKSNIDLEALTTLESVGAHKPNYRRKQATHPVMHGRPRHHKMLRKTKSELNLEDATKIVGATRYPNHQSKSRIDLREATKLSHSNVARVSHHHRIPHHASSSRILDSPSTLERLTSLDT